MVKSTWQSKTLFLLLALLALMWLATVSPPGTMAQNPPTPTNIGGGNGSGHGSNGGNGEEATPKPAGARVSGFVYSYSDGIYVSGVTVVVMGDGWQAEAITDSNGYYQIGDLGAGRGVVNLRLPPGAKPVVFDWPVWLSSGTNLSVNLGYYWNHESALPVLLTGSIADNILTLAVKNQTANPITGGVLEVTAPPTLLLPPDIRASQGSMADYGSHRLRLTLGDLLPGAEAVMSATLKTEAIFSSSAEPVDPALKAIFSYDRQKTVQMVTINPITPLPAVAAVASPSPAQEVGSAVSATPPLSSMALSQPTVSASPTRMAPLPTTGRTVKTSGLTELILAGLLLAGLAVGGWQSRRLIRPKTGTPEK